VNLSEVSILYVEDDVVVRDVLKSLIAAKYPTVPIYPAGTAAEGLDLFWKHHHRIVITDINLAETDSIQMVRAIRTLDPDTVIIFISGCLDVERLTEFEGAASCHYICKPMDCNDLIAVLDNYLNISEKAFLSSSDSPLVPSP